MVKNYVQIIFIGIFSREFLKIGSFMGIIYKRRINSNDLSFVCMQVFDCKLLGENLYIIQEILSRNSYRTFKLEGNANITRILSKTYIT